MAAMTMAAMTKATAMMTMATMTMATMAITMPFLILCVLLRLLNGGWQIIKCVTVVPLFLTLTFLHIADVI